MDPVTASLLMGLGSSVIGTKQIGAPAPAYDASTGQIGALGNEFAPEDLGGDGGLAAILAQYFQPSGDADTVGAEVAALPMPVDTPSVQAAPDAGVPEWFKQGSTPGGFGSGNLAPIGGQGLDGLATPGIGDMVGGDGSLDWFKNQSSKQIEDAAAPSFLGGLGEKAGDFFGNMDQNLDSPSKTLGMGLLGQIDPRLGYAGLLSMGLFGKNKLFGK